MDNNERINFRSKVEPFRRFIIDVTANRSLLTNTKKFYKLNEGYEFIDSTKNRMQNGNFNMSFFSWGSAFELITSEDDYNSEAFNKFKENRIIIAKRLSEERNNIDPSYEPYPVGKNEDIDFPEGYGEFSQQVLLPAFLSAYGNKDPNKVSLNAIPKWFDIMPNWSFRYDGLSKIKQLKKYIRTANINHKYNSSYNIGSFNSNINYKTSGDEIVDIKNALDNYIPELLIDAVTITERFSPLINLDVNWQNNLLTNIKINKDRTLSLSLVSQQITQMSRSELVIGGGYRFEDVQIIFRAGGRQREVKSDLNIRLDFTIRDEITLIRRLTEAYNDITAGQKSTSLNLSADYVLSDRFNLKVFFDRMVNKPHVQLSYPTANTKIGFSIKFTLAQ